MIRFPLEPNKVWRKGNQMSALFLMRKLAVGESLLLASRKSVHASASIGRYRLRYADADPHSQWTTRSRETGVEIMRLPSLTPAAAAQVHAINQARAAQRPTIDRPKRPSRKGLFVEAAKEMYLDEPEADPDDELDVDIFA